jgi:hypothetical protein
MKACPRNAEIEKDRERWEEERKLGRGRENDRERGESEKKRE